MDKETVPEIEKQDEYVNYYDAYVSRAIIVNWLMTV